MRRFIILPLSLLAILVFATGCTQQSSSTKKFKGESQNVASAVESLNQASQKADSKKICSQLFSPQLVKQVIANGGGSCSDKVKKSLEDADDFRVDVVGVTVNGKNATAHVRPKDDKKSKISTFSFVKIGKDWRLVGIENSKQ